jgi:ATP-dependent Clp protease ATP-binding subunit ClpA
MQTTPQKLIELETTLRQRIRGQTEALARLMEAIRRRELNTVPQHGSRGCYIFAGPTGVGKTETARTIAEVLYASDSLLRIDCSEYKTLESLSSLLGDATGSRGRLGHAYARNPQGVWLWDEIEKAHPELVQLFLQMADAGRITLACGDTLDLRDIYLILTTNLGSAEIIGREHLTFTSLERHVIRCIEQFLRPELLGRFSRYAKPIVFRPLARMVQAEIAEQRQSDLLLWHQGEGRLIDVHPEVLLFLIYRGFSARLGARPLLGFIEEQIGNAVAENLMASGTGSGKLMVEGDRLKLLP